MESIIKYLKNPMSMGVYRYSAVIDFSELSKYFDDVVKKLDNAMQAPNVRKLEKLTLEHRLSELKEALKKHNIDKKTDYFKSLLNVFYALYDDDKENPEIRRIFVNSLENSSKTTPAENLFESYLNKDFSDVIVIEKSCVRDETWLFDIITIKKDTILDFKNKIALIPTLKNNIKGKDDKRRFSTRYVYRPYPYVVQLLLEDQSTVPIPNDLKDFVKAAIRYFLIDEWRTSIVLSAIAIESILADIYEEKNHRIAPDIPLGGLLAEVNSKHPFDLDVLKKVEKANNARIAAVHRSRLPVSETDATNALVGATNIILMTHLNSQ
jgi:6-pyruvoyl-tetrahydropterin synthase